MFTYASPPRSTNSQPASDFCADRARRRHEFEQRNTARRHRPRVRGKRSFSQAPRRIEQWDLRLDPIECLVRCNNEVVPDRGVIGLCHECRDDEASLAQNVKSTAAEPLPPLQWGCHEERPLRGSSNLGRTTQGASTQVACGSTKEQRNVRVRSARPRCPFWLLHQHEEQPCPRTHDH